MNLYIENLYQLLKDYVMNNIGQHQWNNDTRLNDQLKLFLIAIHRPSLLPVYLAGQPQGVIDIFKTLHKTKRFSTKFITANGVPLNKAIFYWIKLYNTYLSVAARFTTYDQLVASRLADDILRMERDVRAGDTYLLDAQLPEAKYAKSLQDKAKAAGGYCSIDPIVSQDDIIRIIDLETSRAILEYNRISTVTNSTPAWVESTINVESVVNTFTEVSSMLDDDIRYKGMLNEVRMCAAQARDCATKYRDSLFIINRRQMDSRSYQSCCLFVLMLRKTADDLNIGPIHLITDCNGLCDGKDGRDYSLSDIVFADNKYTSKQNVKEGLEYLADNGTDIARIIIPTHNSDNTWFDERDIKYAIRGFCKDTIPVYVINAASDRDVRYSEDGSTTTIASDTLRRMRHGRPQEINKAD